MTLISPFFLDRPDPMLASLARTGDRVHACDVTGADQMARIASVHRGVASWAEAETRAGHRPVCLAGDCCASIAMVAGLQRAGLDPVLVWLDAHGDFNTFETTISGFIGGMPLAMLVGRGDRSLLAAAAVRPLAETDVVLSDARDLDPAERLAVEGSRLHHVKDAARILDRVPSGRPIHVHFDTDILDPSIAPAMMYATPGGLSAAGARHVMRSLAGTGRVAAVSMTVWDMGKDADGRTARACLSALADLTGERGPG